MGWLEDKERILTLEAEVHRLRQEIAVMVAICDEELGKAAILGYGLDGPYVEHWRGLKERFEKAFYGG